eukprot:SAG11_NODE_710_length_7643_cov_26.058177_1_plen_207_part_10
MKLIFLFLLPLALGMEPEAEPEAEPVAEPEAEPTTKPEPETVSVDPQDVQILKLIKEQFDLQMQDQRAEYARFIDGMEEVYTVFKTIRSDEWHDEQTFVYEELEGELIQAFGDCDHFSDYDLATLGKAVPDLKNYRYYKMLKSASFMDEIVWKTLIEPKRAAVKIQAAARGRAVRRAMKMDDEAAQPSPRTAREPQGMRDLPFDMDG